jgi:restriction endonuclease S subunit
MTTMNQGDLAGIRVPVPPVAQQERFAAELTRLSALGESLQKTIRDQTEALEALPGVLLQQAFNGDKLNG